MDPVIWKRLRSLLNNYQIVTFDILQGKQDSNPHRRFWRPLNYPCSIPLEKAVPCGSPPLYGVELLYDLDNLAGTYGTSTFADGELETFVKGYRSDELNIDLDVVAWHNHLDSFRKADLTGNVKSTDEELRTILVVEWSVTSTLFLLEDVDLSLEVLVRSDGTRLGDDFATLNFLLVDTAEEKTYIVSGLTLIEELAEHLDTRYNGGLRLIAETYDLSRIVDVDGTGLDTSGNYGSTAGD